MAQSRHRRSELRVSRDGWAVNITCAVVAAMLLAGRGELGFLASSSSTLAVSSNAGKIAATPVLMHSSPSTTPALMHSSAAVAPLAWPTCMLVAAAAFALFRRNVGQTPLRRAVLQPRFVALRSLPVTTLAPSEVCCPSTGLQTDLLSLGGGMQSFGSPQSAAAADRLSAVPQQGTVTQAFGEQRSDPLPDSTAPSQKDRQYRRKAGGRHERRHVGARLLKKVYSEMPCRSFEPSKVPARMQRALQSHSFPKTAGSREAKTKADADSASSTVMGLHTFDIRNMVVSYLCS
eukprot:TRINITY_DN76309_c0_g1_i1.p1 TRINITY_DN76309_c0_g1~~TRINITY_DN76309_c0_g1_i1.p1  ORF type:complete len:290 (-),score=40.48 TRINITY_DN76309_c0_g1_i1:63-932(-)